ncbi:Hint domain-containing protein [Advenella incenata]|uniref:Hint domain-containing protein n=1 Tax=Advenella incenata TaxID=267800 RepID=A0A4Q7VFH2_9BURK|nr:Hint domain-containing protein [Advenella incenata]RZT94258.1 Hint domain-containing protein [Advenella incenata]
MATINFTALGTSTQSYDQGQNPDDSVLNVNIGIGAVGTKNVNITNVDNVEGPLTLNQTVSAGLLSTQNINIGENVDLVQGGLAGVNIGNTFNYNLSANSSFTMNPATVNIGALNTVNIDMGDSGTSTFTYDSTGVNLDLSAFPTITNISAGDQINVANATSGSYENGDLIFKNDLGITVGRFNADGLDPTQVTFDGGSMTYACFLKGTHIATLEGEKTVESLVAGDKVITASGGVATVKWLGHRTLYKSRIPAKDAVRAFPILIKKDAIADNVPHADLIVSPGHHLEFNGALVPAMMLVNGQTIVQQFERRSFEYFHVELEQFDIILAEGVPAESYVDMGNRSMFQNADEVAMNPDFGPSEGRPNVEGLVIARDGAIVEAIRKQLLARAELLTGAQRTKDAALCVEVNGRVIQATPEFVKEGVYRFELPANAGDVRIVSRSSLVRDVTHLARRDIRRVGVGLSAIAFTDSTGRHDIDLMDSRISGMNQPQDVKGTAMRWTTGSAVIPAGVIQSAGKATLELTVLRTYSYWLETATEKAVKAA